MELYYWMTESRPIYSSAIPEPKDWADASLLLPHEAIRTLLVGMRNVEIVQDNVKPFFSWYEKYFFEFVP